MGLREALEKQWREGYCEKPLGKAMWIWNPLAKILHCIGKVFKQNMDHLLTCRFWHKELHWVWWPDDQCWFCTRCLKIRRGK